MKHFKDMQGKAYGLEDDGSQDYLIEEHGLAEISEAELFAILNPPPTPLTKEQRKRVILDALPNQPDRFTVQLGVQLGELTATVQAPAYGLTVPQAIAYAYSKNPAYRRVKDAENALMAIDAEPA